jgi:hypothetical protein
VCVWGGGGGRASRRSSRSSRSRTRHSSSQGRKALMQRGITSQAQCELDGRQQQQDEHHQLQIARTTAAAGGCYPSPRAARAPAGHAG